ncbi:hypothetical protein [Yokenella regensburgei]|uniref:hypothetical protein n=1 Tax=Yokenella regensburgei TaxID=158877 RepID=UPI001432E901|nr:hypothetical protein [Yokenella regensburgei]QIU88445.1 hypothetical protein HEC60_03260 [Yokenella regensburgei]
MNTANRETHNLDQLTSVELRIQSASGSNTPAIYANGLNRLDVEILAKAIMQDPDSGDDIVLNISEAEWLRHLTLTHAPTDDPLNKEGREGWCFSESSNEYTREIPGSITDEEADTVQNGRLNNSLASSLTSVSLYLYTYDVSAERISVALNLDDGRHFTTSDLSEGSEKMSVKINAITPINYNKAELFDISDGGWVVNGTSFERRSQVFADPHGHYTTNNCVIQHKIKSISLANNGYEILHKEVRSTGIPLGYTERTWLQGRNSVRVDAIKLIDEGNDTTRKGGYLNAWYTEPNNGEAIGFARWLNRDFGGMAQDGWPTFYFSGEPSGAYDYGVWAYWPRFDINNPPYPYSSASKTEGSVSVYCYQLHIPNDSGLYWGKHCKPTYPHIEDPAQIYIVDNYGNSGEFNIVFGNSIKGDITISVND